VVQLIIINFYIKRNIYYRKMCYLIINIEAKASSLIKHVQILLYTGFFVLEYQINVTLGYVNRTIYSKYMLKMFYRCEQWVINSRREDLLKPWPDETWEQAVHRMNRNKFLCGNHFEESQFMNATLLCPQSLIYQINPNPLHQREKHQTDNYIIQSRRNRI
jgi:hypothetical protein